MPKPVLQAMVLADHVYREADTGKFLIIGTFGSLTVRRPRQAASSTGQPPSDDGTRTVSSKDVTKAGSPYLYLALTGIHGKVNLELKYIDLSDATVIFEGNIELECPNPLIIAEFNVPLPPLPVRVPIEPGTYSLDLLHDGEILGAW